MDRGEGRADRPLAGPARPTGQVGAAARPSRGLASRPRLARFAGWLILALSLAWVALTGARDWQATRHERPPAPTPAGVGAGAPDFTVTTLDGRTIQSAGYRGQPLVVNFFASWCDPCKEETPVLNTLAAGASTNGYTVLGVAIQDEREALARFAHEEGLRFPIALDTNNRVARAYRIVGPPTTVFIDADGVIRALIVGPLTAESAAAALRDTDKRVGAPPAGQGSAQPAGNAITAGPATILLALGAGLLSFLSPCCFPLLPAYLGYITGVSAEELRQRAGGQRRSGYVTTRTVAFAAGLVVVFTALGASASYVGGWMTDHRTLLSRLSGLVVLVFGLHLAGLLRVPVLDREFRPGLQAGGVRSGPFGAAALGGAFAIGWTPCVGPMLGSLLLLAGQARSVGTGTLLLAMYGVGLGMPFVVTGLLAERTLLAVGVFRRWTGRIERASGLLLAGLGLLLVSGRLNALVMWLQRLV